MSIFVHGSDRQIAKVQELALQLANTTSTLPYVENLPVDIPSIKGNRRTNASTLLKTLSEEGGFNPGLWRFPNVIKTTAEVGRKWLAESVEKGYISEEELEYYERGFIGDYFYCRWDGDHRHKIWKGNNNVPINEPCDLKYDCMVYEVDKVQQANDLFVKIQKTRQKSLGPDDEWCSAFLAQDPKHLKQADMMKQCNVGVRDSNGDVYPKGLFNDQAWIRSRVFNLCVNKYGFENTKQAIEDTVEILSVKSKWNKEVYDSIYAGLAALYKVRPLAAKNGLNTKIKEVLKGDALKSKKDFIEIYKTKGGNEHNREFESVAYGIARYTKSAIQEGTFGSNTNAGEGLGITSLKNDLGLKGE